MDNKPFQASSGIEARVQKITTRRLTVIDWRNEPRYLSARFAAIRSVGLRPPPYRRPTTDDFANRTLTGDVRRLLNVVRRVERVEPRFNSHLTEFEGYMALQPSIGRVGFFFSAWGPMPREFVEARAESLLVHATKGTLASYLPDTSRVIIYSEIEKAQTIRVPWWFRLSTRHRLPRTGVRLMMANGECV